MFAKKALLTTLAVVFLSFTFSVPAASAKPNEFDAIVSHLKTKYQAKKKHIPMMWLARFAVRLARPAGVKSFNITLFDDLKFSAEKLDVEMQEAMRRSFTADWSSIFHVRSRDGQQAYMYMRDDGRNVKLALVTIDKTEAAVIRATISPERLASFINDPKIFGVSLSDEGKQATETPQVPSKPEDDH